MRPSTFFINWLSRKKIIVLEKENASPGAAVTVTASANLEKEGTVDLVLLGSENRGQVLSHLETFLVPLLLAPLNSFSANLSILLES